MLDLFLKVDRTEKLDQAMSSALGAALQRNKVYTDDDSDGWHSTFRERWAHHILQEAKPYYLHDPISDEQHCSAIARISDSLSSEFGSRLVGDRLRFGTSQKAFNLYLKYLWAFDVIPEPPHCPIDSIILGRLGITTLWTKSDSCDEYMSWIVAIRKRLSIATWEHETWLRSRLCDMGL